MTPASLVQALRRHAWALPCFALIAVVYVIWTANDQIGYFANDATWYLMMARHYALFGPGSAVYDQAATYSYFPPLYPMLLALAGTGGRLYAAHLATTGFLLAALAAYYGWLLAVGASAAQAALMMLLAALLPGSWLQALGLMSESLYLFWSLLALCLLTLRERAALRGYHDQLLYAAALAIAAATLTRSAGVALLAPLAVAAWRAPCRAALLAAGFALLPMLAWSAVHQAHQSYGEAMRALYGPAWWSSLGAQLATELPALRAGLVQDLVHAPVTLGPLPEMFGMVLVGGIAGRALRLQPDGIYAVVYLAILLVWPYPDQAWRFLWVLLPIALFQWVLVAAEWLGRGALKPGLALTALAVLIPALPSAAFAVQRYDAGSLAGRAFASWYDLDPAQAQSTTHAQLVLIAAMRRIRERTPADACVIGLRTDLINYYGERRSALPPFNSTPDPLYQRLLRSAGCRYVFMSTMTRGTMYPQPLYPLHRLDRSTRILDYVDEADPPPGTGRTIALLAQLDAVPVAAPR